MEYNRIVKSFNKQYLNDNNLSFQVEVQNKLGDINHDLNNCPIDI